MAKSSRAASVRARWAEAKAYARRHGTSPRLDRRTVSVNLTNADIEAKVRRMFKEPKRRLPGGRRGTESGRLRRDAYFRLSLLDQAGAVQGQSGVLKFQRLERAKGETARQLRGRETQELVHTLRRANNGVFNLFTDYAKLKGKVEVTEAGSFIVEGEPWAVVVEPDVAGEPLLPEYQGAEA